MQSGSRSQESIRKIQQFIYVGKRCDFSFLQNIEIEVQARSAGGKEFHKVGAVKEKERRPLADRISGTVRKPAEEDRRLRDGRYEEISSAMYEGQCRINHKAE